MDGDDRRPGGGPRSFLWRPASRTASVIGIAGWAIAAIWAEVGVSTNATLVAAWCQREAKMYCQPMWYSVFRRDCPAHRFDIAACDRQPDPEMVLAGFIRRFGVSLDIIAFEYALELFGGNPRSLIGDGQMGKAAVSGQVHQDLALRRGKRNGIIDQVFGDAFHHVLCAEHEKTRDKIC